MADDKADLGADYVDRVLDVLEVLARRGEPPGLSELARAAGVNKTTVYRILAALQRRGYAVQDDRARYALSPAWWGIGRASLGGSDLRERLRPALRRLRDDLRETVHLGIYRRGGTVVYLDVAESPRPLRVSPAVGLEIDAHAVASGKALLAFQDEEEIARVGHRLRRHTARTITDPGRLRAALAEVRERGYAVVEGEYEEGLCGVAVPVPGVDGEVAAAVGCSLPCQRLDVPGIVAALRGRLGPILA
jgi:DNA-binding IclR family transcriptional regulator